MRLIELPKINDKRGNLTFIQKSTLVPFEIKRTYWIYDVPGGEERGGHAFRAAEEVIIALSGSFDVVVNEGIDEQVFSLNRSYRGLYIPPMNWRKINNFSTNAVALIISSVLYDAEDYIRDFELFKKLKNE